MAAGPRSLTYSSEIGFLEELFIRIAPGKDAAVESRTLQQLGDMLCSFLEVALEKEQLDRVEKIMSFQEIMRNLLGASMMDPASVEIIPYTRLPEPKAPPPVGLRLFAADTAVIACPICFDDKPQAEMVTLHACGSHGYCKECLGQHLSSSIIDAEVSNIVCPHPSCAAQVLEAEVRELVDEDTYQKYLHFLVLAILKEEQNARWCTNLACGQPIIWDPKESVVVCPACKSEFCFECSRPLHPGFSCAGQQLPDYERLFQEWLQEKDKKVKPCPGCQAPLEKNDGCNHMTCRCGAQWCWLCSERMEGRNHFGEGPCHGFQFIQFDTREEAIAERERRAAEEQRQQELERERERQAEEARIAAIERRRQLEESRRQGGPPPAGSPICQHCGSAFYAWSELFSHTGLGCPANASTSRTHFMR